MVTVNRRSPFFYDFQSFDSPTQCLLKGLRKGNNLEKVGVGLDPVVEVLDPSEDGRIVRIAIVDGKRIHGHLQSGHHQW